MDALKIIGWFLWLCFAMLVLAEAGQVGAMIRMFPEGRRWWTGPAQVAAMGFFASAVLCHPF